MDGMEYLRVVTGKLAEYAYAFYGRSVTIDGEGSFHERRTSTKTSPPNYKDFSTQLQVRLGRVARSLENVLTDIKDMGEELDLVRRRLASSSSKRRAKAALTLDLQGPASGLTVRTLKNFNGPLLLAILWMYDWTSFRLSGLANGAPSAAARTATEITWLQQHQLLPTPRGTVHSRVEWLPFVMPARGTAEGAGSGPSAGDKRDRLSPVSGFSEPDSDRAAAVGDAQPAKRTRTSKSDKRTTPKKDVGAAFGGHSKASSSSTRTTRSKGEADRGWCDECIDLDIYSGMYLFSSEGNCD